MKIKDLHPRQRGVIYDAESKGYTGCDIVSIAVKEGEDRVQIARDGAAKKRWVDPRKIIAVGV